MYHMALSVSRIDSVCPCHSTWMASSMVGTGLFGGLEKEVN